MKVRRDDQQVSLNIIGEQISAWRKSKGLTQEYVAEKAGLGRTHLSRIESGQANPSLLTLYNIAVSMYLPLNRMLTERPYRDTGYN